MQMDVTQAVRTAVESIVGSCPDAHQPLMEAGLDSLGAVELRNSLSSRFSMDLPATLTFDYPSIAALVQFFTSHISCNILSTSDHETASLTSSSYLSSEVSCQQEWQILSSYGMQGIIYLSKILLKVRSERT